MDFNFTEEQLMIQDVARRIAQEKIAPSAEHFDRTGEFPLENIQLLGLTYRMQLDGGSLDGTLARLHVYTWLKWGGLALYFLLLIPYFRGLSGPWRWVWLPALLPAVLAAAAFLKRGLANELLALSIGLMFLLLTAYALAGSKGQVASGR